jgi:4-amino-4-deoxy-L-arabinose transferase-like glycosyltransferase
MRLTSGRQAALPLVVMLAAVCFFAIRAINGAAISDDAVQNLLMALNVAHHGTMSLDEAAPLRPTMYREPLPVGIDALLIRLEDRSLGRDASAAYFSDGRARLLKYQNVVWLCLLSTVVFAVTRWLTGSYLAALLAGLVAVRPFLSSTSAEGVNDLYTELPGAALLTLAAGLMAAASRRGNPGLTLGAGVCFGLATLTKAATLYVYVILAIVLGVIWLWRSDQRRARIASLALLLLGFAVVVAPWMWRNEELFHSPQISERGGLVLYTRALFDQMTPLEYRGSVYVWARPAAQRLLGPWLGFTADDLQRGGRLQRLNQLTGSELDRSDLIAEDAGDPARAVTFYHQARAMRVQLEARLERAGNPYPEVSADHALQRMATTLIRQHPAEHLAMIPPLIWRGAPTLFPLLLLTLAYAIATRQRELALFVLPAFGTLCFYALLTHFEARPARVTQGIAAAALLTILSDLTRRWLRSRGRLPSSSGSTSEGMART